MSDTETIEKTETSLQKSMIINDFSITVGTINGSGSQTSNLIILRSLFKMGIPVSGKNIFPSNIQGQPTWYTIRVNTDGFLARRDEHEIVIAMNPDSFLDDLSSVESGGVFLYADHIDLPINRNDIYTYSMPVKKLSRESDAPSNLRDYVANMVYVGILAFLLGIDPEKIRQALEFHFNGKEKPMSMNYGVIENSYNWASKNLKKKDPYKVKAMDATHDNIMADGNTAAALGAIYGGIQLGAWYPITPASSIAEKMIEYLPLLRKDPKCPGKNTYVILQAEDELAAIGMTIGAGWAGLRAMTSTSGPGLSLMAEYAGLAYFAEVPIVVWDVQRVGPSTGLPTRTAQGDIIFTHYLGHGDTQQIMLFPGSVNECFEFGWRAFDIAEQIQTPVFVMSDLDLGMNQWMTPPFEYPDEPIQRGKVLWEGDLDRLEAEWGRYLDIDGDTIPYRTIPGNRHWKAAYFARGTGHDEYAHYSEDSQEWLKLNERLKNKFVVSKAYVPKPILREMEEAKIGILAYGSTDPAIIEAQVILREANINTNYLRLRAIPFTNEVEDFINKHSRIYIVEMNRDGQMSKLLMTEFPNFADKLTSVAYLDGLPFTARFVANAIMDKEEG